MTTERETQLQFDLTRPAEAQKREQEYRPQEEYRRDVAAAFLVLGGIVAVSLLPVTALALTWIY